MSLKWPTWQRVGLSAFIVVFLFVPIAGYDWVMFPIAWPSPSSGGDPHFVTEPVGPLSDRLADRFGWFAIPEAVLASLAGVVIFSVLTRFLGDVQRRQTLCRQCGKVLKGVTEPKCPACGEPI